MLMCLLRDFKAVKDGSILMKAVLSVLAVSVHLDESFLLISGPRILFSSLM